MVRLRVYRGWNAWNIRGGYPFNLICLIKFVSDWLCSPLSPTETRLFRNSIDPWLKPIPPPPLHIRVERKKDIGNGELGDPWNPHTAGTPFHFYSLFLRPRWTLREWYPHHLLDESASFGHQPLGGLAQRS